MHQHTLFIKHSKLDSNVKPQALSAEALQKELQNKIELKGQLVVKYYSMKSKRINKMTKDKMQKEANNIKCKV